MSAAARSRFDRGLDRVERSDLVAIQRQLDALAAVDPEPFPVVDLSAYFDALSECSRVLASVARIPVHLIDRDADLSLDELVAMDGDR